MQDGLLTGSLSKRSARSVLAKNALTGGLKSDQVLAIAATLDRPSEVGFQSCADEA